MSRYKHVAAFVGVCLCLGWLSEIAAAQAEVVFTASNTTQTVRVTQNGPGIPNPSLTNQPPAALRGEATSSIDSTVGVIGTSAGSFGFGVFGISSGTPGSTDNPTGVVGFASSASGKTRGVAGFIFSPDGIAVDAESHGGGLLFAGSSGPLGSEVTKFSVDADGNLTTAGALNVGNGALSVAVDGSLNVGNGAFSVAADGSVSARSGIATAQITPTGDGLIVNGGLNVTGNLFVAGAKSSVAALRDGRSVALYAMESPENWFEDFGTAQLHHGAVQVTIERLFAETVNSDLSYRVFLTPNGNCRGLYIAKKTSSGFEVRELGGGKSNVAFDYRIVVRRIGIRKVALGRSPALTRAPVFIRVSAS